MDKFKQIDTEVKKIHSEIKRSNLALQVRMKDICEELQDWNITGGQDEERNGNGWL